MLGLIDDADKERQKVITGNCKQEGAVSNKINFFSRRLCTACCDHDRISGGGAALFVNNHSDIVLCL